jgi:hypothetical protein
MSASARSPRARPGRAILMLLLPSLFAPALAGAATHAVPAVGGEVRCDARLDEPFWQEALRLELSVEVQPGENIPALVRTEALLAHNEDAFLVGIVAHDPRPEEIRARISDRDQIDGDDWVALILDTFNDNRRCFDFFLNPLGVQADATEGMHGGGMSWDAVWDGAGRLTAEGYVLEYVIPFRSLRFQRSEAGQTWGLDIVRSYPRSVDHRLTLFPRDRSNNCYMCQAEKIVGFAGVAPGRHVEVAPTFTSVVHDAREDWPEGDLARTDESHEPGLTARWGFTPNLTAAATLNPDFSQVEADVVQLDINRQYALYYPETRPFFVEDSEFFSTSLQAVHTRTLADPRWGVKLTGKEGPQAVGFYTVEDDVTNLLFPGPLGSRSTSVDRRSTGTILRYRRDVGEGSTLGFLVTDREGEDGYYNRLGSLTGRLLVTQKDMLRFQFMGSHTRYPAEVAAANGQPRDVLKGNAYEFLYMHDTRGIDWYGIYRQTDTGLRADLGFMPQAGYRNWELGWGHTWQGGPDGWWNMLNVGSAWEVWQMISGLTLDQAGSVWFDYEGLSQTYLDLRGYHDFSWYEGRDYELTFLNYSCGVAPTGLWELHVDGMVGDSLDYLHNREGTLLNLESQLELRLGRHLKTTLLFMYEQLDVDAGRLYTANVGQLRLVYQFSRRAFLRTILQRANYRRNLALYADETDAQSKRLFSQLLFSYTVNPQTVLYLGYSDNYLGDQDLGLTQSDRTFFAKLGYAWVL